MIKDRSIPIEAVSCLLAQGGFLPPLHILAMRIANAARLQPFLLKVKG